MIGLLREIPDWGVGALLGGTAWFGAAYSVLAPRAMENDQQTEIIPACFAQLREDEGVAIDQHVRELTSEARREIAHRTSQIDDELAGLFEQLAKIEVTNSSVEYYNSTPLAQLAPMPDFGLSAAPVKGQIKALQDEVASLRLPTFDIPRAPSEEVMTACGCSVSIAMGGAQMAYGLSLASFRIWTPEEMTEAKSGWADILQTEKCGSRSWESLS